MKARSLCTILGIALATALVAFMRGLVATNDHQATAWAERLLQSVPVEPAAKVCRATLDYRPQGRVLQGPPLVVSAATTSAPLERGTCRVTRALFAQRELPVPPVGTRLKLVGEKGTSSLEIAEILDWEKPVRGYPNLFVSPETAAQVGETWTAWTPKSADAIAPLLTSDAARHFDRAKALLLWAAALTALCLLVNTLFLAIEADRREIALWRVLGLRRSGVAVRVLRRSLALALVGSLAGLGLARVALAGFVALEPAEYPMGSVLPVATALGALVAAVFLSLVAALLALRPALAVRPLEAASSCLPRRRHLGMVISFACGFGAFVAVEVWGASLMSAFLPSPEWPDAIVSVLPGGVSSFEVEKLRNLTGVGRLAELQPLQVNLDPLEELPARGEGRGRGKAYRNALLLASDWFPFCEVPSGDGCVITRMMARARRLDVGDKLRLDCGRGFKMALDIVGIADLNWHMVTSRGLVRGLNRMPVYTDGPVFVSFDTLAACDARPQELVKMTHLWLNFKPDFEKALGPFEAGRRVEREIADRLVTDESAVRLHARDEVAEGTLAHGDELIGAMARVPFVFIAVLSLGFVALLVASVEARRREFRVLRAIGATRFQLAQVLVGEALRVALVGTALGLVGGMPIGWLCTAATRAAMSGWGLPANFVVPFVPILEGLAGAVTLALAVAVPTAFRLVRERH